MSVFSRMWNLVAGFFNREVSNIESKNPEIVYDQAIDSAIKKQALATKAVAGIIANRQRTEDQLKKAQAEKAQIESDLEAAMATDNEELGAILIQRLEQADQNINSLSNELDHLSAQAEDSKASLMQFRDEINRLKKERDINVARHHTAKAQLQMQEQLNGLSVDDEIKALTGVRESIEKSVAQVQLNKEMEGTDVERQLANLRKTAGSSTAAAKFRAMQAARKSSDNKTL